jgi:hypothetical protein
VKSGFLGVFFRPIFGFLLVQLMRLGVWNVFEDSVVYVVFVELTV